MARRIYSTEAAHRRVRQLGMPFGTASHRLRKLILFSLLVRLGENFCYRCGAPIGRVEELSIEHKEPWEGQDGGEALFWDLGNIGFSHLSCNSGAGRRHPELLVALNMARRKIGPEGTSWCFREQRFVDKDRFDADNSKWNKLSSECRDCHDRRLGRKPVKIQ